MGIHYIVAFTGKMRSGKDTAKKMLESALQYKIMTTYSSRIKAPVLSSYAFGDEVKRYAEELFPDTYRKDGVKDRKVLQLLGQSMRAIDKDIWVKKLDEKIKKKEIMVFKTPNFNPHVERLNISFITDVRQPNEYEYAKKNGNLIIKIEADDDVRLERISNKGESTDEELLNHETESYIDGYEVDYVVDNSSDEVELRRQITPIVDRIIEDVLQLSKKVPLK